MKPTRTLATATTPDGSSLVLQEHDGQFYMRLNGTTTLMSTRAFASEQEMATLACAKLQTAGAADARLLIGGLGFGYTLQKVMELLGQSNPDTTQLQIDVAELLPEIIEWNRSHLQSVNGQLLDDPRVTMHQADVFKLIHSSAQLKANSRYDAIMMDVDNSPDAFVQSDNARLYSYSGLSAVQRALKPNGRVVFWSANQDQSFADELRLVFKRIEIVRAKAYPAAKRFTHTLFVADC